MTSFTDEYGEVINPRFPEEKFESYINMFGLTSFKEATFTQQQKMFLYIIADFKSGKNSLDEMSSLAGEMYSYPEDNDTPELAELKSALYDCSELNFYVRRILEIDSEIKGSSFISMILSVMEYYQKYQHLIQKELDAGMRKVITGGKVAVLQELVSGLKKKN